MLIEANENQDKIGRERSSEAAPCSAPDAGTCHLELLARLFRARMPYIMLSFLAISALAAIPELSAHPERASTYALVYALEAQAWLVALTLIRSDGLTYAKAVLVALLTTIAMMALITGYHVAVSSDAAVLLVTLSYVTVGSMVVFPWQPQAQLVVAAASVIAYVFGLSAGVQTTASSGTELLGLATVAALTVGSVSAAEQYRRRLLDLTAGERAYQ